MKKKKKVSEISLRSSTKIPISKYEYEAGPRPNWVTRIFAGLATKTPIGILAEIAYEAFEKRPKTVGIVFLILTLSSTFVIVVDLANQKRMAEQKMLEYPEYRKQTKTLSETEESLRRLLTFVQTQKKHMADREKQLLNLKEEHEKLRPIVESDRKLVELILDTQQSKSKSDVWSERVYGFAFGIVASLTASFIWHFGQKILKRGR